LTARFRSLLRRLRESPRREDWDRLVALYTPLLSYRARRAPAPLTPVEMAGKYGWKYDLGRVP
jgi:hypothetical protein